jgi:hypothetical protein
MSGFDSSFKKTRLINWNNNRIKEYNDRVNLMNNRKIKFIEKLEERIENQENIEQRKIDNAQSTLEKDLANGMPRFQANRKFRNSVRRARRAKGFAQRKLRRQINKTNRQHPNKVKNSTRQKRQTMYSVATWAERFRTERRDQFLFVTKKEAAGPQDVGKRIPIRGRFSRVRSTVNLSRPYPTDDLNMYSPSTHGTKTFFGHNCIYKWRISCLDRPPGSAYDRCQAVTDGQDCVE